MSNIEEIKKYLDFKLEKELGFLSELGYIFSGGISDCVRFGIGKTIYTFESVKCNRKVELIFSHEAQSQSGCIHIYIKRHKELDNEGIYNSLSIHLPLKNFYSYEFKGGAGLVAYLTEANNTLSGKYRQTLEGREFKHDRVFRA